jgi:dTDP-4-amino-4,6-dideoxygalactose transaminase
MIERYRPDLHLATWMRWLMTGSGEASQVQGDFIRSLGSYHQDKHPLVFMNARSGIYAYFNHLRHRVGRGTVLIPAQICPVVPYAIRACGFVVRFIDSDDRYPSPSSGQYLDGLTGETVAVVISPLYGYLPGGFQEFGQSLREVKIFLDMAQGLLLADLLDPQLLQRADALVYSFAPGKGVDTGGGLLLTKDRLEVSGYRLQKKIHYLPIFSQVMLLRFLIISNLYSVFLKRLEREIEVDKEEALAKYPGKLAPAEIFSLWQAKLQVFAGDIQRARKRAVRLSKSALVQQACDSSFFDGSAIHLRQVLRFRDVRLRDQVMQSLRRDGVDCAPAGEALPSEYFAEKDLPDFPKARAFRQESLRLPFLGRLCEREFQQLQQTLEVALAQHLSQRV